MINNKQLKAIEKIMSKKYGKEWTDIDYSSGKLLATIVVDVHDNQNKKLQKKITRVIMNELKDAAKKILGDYTEGIHLQIGLRKPEWWTKIPKNLTYLFD